MNKQEAQAAIENIYFTAREKKRLGASVKATKIRIQEQTKTVTANVVLHNGQSAAPYFDQKYSFKELEVVLRRSRHKTNQIKPILH